MINLILKTDILPVGGDATTNVICKIIHSERKHIKLFQRDGTLFDEITENDIYKNDEQNSSDVMESSGNTDEKSPEEVAELGFPPSTEGTSTNDDVTRKDRYILSVLKNIFESASDSSTGIDIRFVEIYYPIEILKGNITIVDTPGVGDCVKLNQILEEYLPYAVAFVFILNPSGGGGMQKDRILKVMNSINAQERSMVCFEPSDVIFIVNKWDAVYDKEESVIEQEWNKVVKKIKDSWPSVHSDNIIKMSTKLLNCKTARYAENFSCFETTLRVLVDKNINKRIKANHRFLKAMLNKVENFVNIRIAATNGPFLKLKTKLEGCLERLKELEKRSKTTFEDCTKMMDAVLKKHGKKLLAFIRSEEFKNQVLYVDSELQTTLRFRIDMVIKERMKNVISLWIERNESCIKSELDDILCHKFEEIYGELQDELEDFGYTSNRINISEILKTILSGVVGIGAGLISLVVLAPFVTAEVCTAGAAVVMILSFNISKKFLGNLTLTRSEIIDNSFSTRRNEITQDMILQILDKEFGAQFRHSADELFCQLIPQDIKMAESLLKNVKKDYNRDLKKRAALIKLSFEILKVKERLQCCHFLGTIE
ncbi:dynamin-like protein 1 [Saccostrea cucullata]|uniref:dynamin-like protein 1 n=1 Tax=Saccostrea cuccullata TaxID=36930 RepID=UPI002ED1D2B6